MARTAGDALLLKVLATLNEAQARWYVGREAVARGRGGIEAMHELTGLSRATIAKGVREVTRSRALGPREGIRRAGAGRWRLEQTDPGFEQALRRIMDDSTAGDPMNRLRWTHKSTGRIAEELARQGHRASDETVRRRLRALGYSLQANVKTQEGPAPVERDAQFRYINRQVRRFARQQAPVLSVDTKKKERVGNFKNAGRTWRRAGQPRAVNIYDFPELGIGPAIPYGAYDVQRNHGFVNVGMTHDTAEFAVESIRRWWRLVGHRHYPTARMLLVCADGGGSNGSRNRGWKFHLQQLADDLGLAVTVCHYPPGTSKWNKIEHRMFSFISLNWKGQPLVSYETVVNLISGTRTRTGLRVTARLDRTRYEKGVVIPDAEMASLSVRQHPVHPQWNYTITPRTRISK